MAEATNTPNPSDPHPYAFAGLQEARQALRWHMLAAEKAGFQDLRRVTDTMGAFALAMSEAGQENDPRVARAWGYLTEQLDDIASDIEEWNQRAWLLSVIVTDNDLGALAKYPGTEMHAPPAAAGEG